ncbi:hypothetical protein DNTS_017888 [Danionella cerebrum]|uniref:Phosphatidylinositol transfer protein N-terminal domain-containing protein n=1 Tax=Danionella cerebrum TaxID=2873325 RepID=A0A553N247_9TELE|nr:hypothetical protein DNTS_017888 [Danionella translucida]
MLVKEYRICMPLTVEESFRRLETKLNGLDIPQLWVCLVFSCSIFCLFLTGHVHTRTPEVTESSEWNPSLARSLSSSRKMNQREFSHDVMQRLLNLIYLSVVQYRIGQLYMISKHSSEQSGGGEGVEVIRNEPCTDPTHGAGQITEKRIYLHSKLPTWVRKFVPMVFYLTETAWNFYPYTITGQFKKPVKQMFSILTRCVLKLCFFSAFLFVFICCRLTTEFTLFSDGPTSKDNICFLDILTDPIPDKHFKKSEDLSSWVSEKTGRGPLVDGWRNTTKPIMCSYKRVTCSFEVYGFQGRTEDFVHRNIRDILLVGHRQAVAWIDEWHGSDPPIRPSFTRSISVTDESSLKKLGVMTVDSESCPPSLKSPLRLHSTPE